MEKYVITKDNLEKLLRESCNEETKVEDFCTLKEAIAHLWDKCYSEDLETEYNGFFNEL